MGKGSRKARNADAKNILPTTTFKGPTTISYEVATSRPEGLLRNEQERLDKLMDREYRLRRDELRLKLAKKSTLLDGNRIEKKAKNRRARVRRIDSSTESDSDEHAEESTVNVSGGNSASRKRCSLQEKTREALIEEIEELRKKAAAGTSATTGTSDASTSTGASASPGPSTDSAAAGASATAGPSTDSAAAETTAHAGPSDASTSAGGATTATRTEPRKPLNWAAGRTRWHAFDRARALMIVRLADEPNLAQLLRLHPSATKANELGIARGYRIYKEQQGREEFCGKCMPLKKPDLIPTSARNVWIFANRRALELHLELHVPEGTSFECEGKTQGLVQCSATFTTFRRYESHVSNEHAEIKHLFFSRQPLRAP